jgi:hypothetical protein
MSVPQTEPLICVESQVQVRVVVALSPGMSLNAFGQAVDAGAAEHVPVPLPGKKKLLS